MQQRFHQDVNDLRQRLIDVSAGVEQSVIHDAIDQRHRRLHSCIRGRGGMSIHRDTN